MASTYNSLDGLISPKALINMRLQGMSLAKIAKSLDIGKSSLSFLLNKYKAQNFDGYVPIDIEELKNELNSNMTFAQIAYKHELSPLGLKNYMTDYDIESRLTEKRLREVAATARSKAAIAEYFGVDAHTIYTAMKKYNID